MLSITEEKYLKTILNICWNEEVSSVGTNFLAENLGIKPSSVNEMLKKLRTKKLIEQERYGKITLTNSGKTKAIEIIRKHRLWETFLYEKLHFTWDEVHDIAEQLEHIQSVKLTDRLYKYLGCPKVDPHGDPIPDTEGNIEKVAKCTLSEIPIGKTCRIVAVRDNSSSFLKYVMSLDLGLQDEIRVLSREEFDGQMKIAIGNIEKIVSKKFSDAIWVVQNEK